MAATSLGVAVNFAFTGTDGAAFTGTGIGTFTLQSAKHSKTADRYEVKDAAGVLSNVTFANPGEHAVLEYLIRGSGLADALTQTKIPYQGIVVAITACASLPEIVGTTNGIWFVDGEPEISGSNTDFKKVTLPLTKNPGISAVTSN